MSDSETTKLAEPEQPAKAAGEAPQHSAGLPLPRGPEGRPAASGDNARRPAVPPPGRAPVGSASERTNGFQRVVGAVRVALPFMQRLLPLLDGNVGSAVSNVLVQRPQQSTPSRLPSAPATPPPVNLKPIEASITELRAGQSLLRNEITEQNTTLKRVDDQLQSVRDATDRNTLEQQELLEDLKTFSKKSKIFAIVISSLLGVSIILNVLLLLRFQHMIP